MTTSWLTCPCSLGCAGAASDEIEIREILVRPGPLRVPIAVAHPDERDDRSDLE
jgi:hypothetical protein